MVLQSNYRGFKERKKFKERKTAMEGGSSSGSLAVASQRELDGCEDREKKEEEVYEDEESTYEAEEEEDDGSDHTQVPEDDSYLATLEDVELENLVGPPANEGKETAAAAAGDVDEETRAATVLQSNFRGHKERKRLQEEGKIPAKKSRAEELEVPMALAKDVDEPLDVTSIDVLLENQDETRAAVVLQSNFRGHKERKRLQEEGKIMARKGRAEEPEVPKVEEEETMLGNTAEEEEVRAATVLQSNFRGHQERKKLRAAKEARLEGTEETAVDPAPVKEKEDDDALDVNDIVIRRRDEAEMEMERQEEEHAAVKIQSNFRGYKERKNLRANQHAARTQAAQLESFSKEVRPEVQKGALVSRFSLLQTNSLCLSSCSCRFAGQLRTLRRCSRS